MEGATQHKIIIADSRSMPEVNTESIHLIITSPPIGNLKITTIVTKLGLMIPMRNI